MNNVNIIGRITNDLEVRKVGQDLSLLAFTVALNERYGSNEESYFFDVTSWGRQAETIATYFKKGQRIGINGRLKQERFQDKEGKNRSRIVIVLRDFDFIEPKDFGGSPVGSPESPRMTPPPTAPSSPPGAGPSDNLGFPSFPENQSFEDDEVPF